MITSCNESRMILKQHEFLKDWLQQNEYPHRGLFPLVNNLQTEEILSL